MNDYTPTTEDVRGAYADLARGWFDLHDVTQQEALAEFDRWLEQVKQEARAEGWDEGFTDGINHDLGDWEHPPEIINNPYRQKEQDQ